MLADLGRVSAEDLATAMSEEFAGAKGLAKIARQLLMAPSTPAATKTRILGNIQQLLSNTSKLYGDRAKLSDKNKDQLEIRLLELLKKHHMVVPLPGINVHVSPTDQPVHQESQEATAAAQQ